MPAKVNDFKVPSASHSYYQVMKIKEIFYFSVAMPQTTSRSHQRILEVVRPGQHAVPLPQRIQIRKRKLSGLVRKLLRHRKLGTFSNGKMRP